MDRVTPKSTLKTKSDNVERVGSGTTIHQQVRPLQVGKQLHGGHLHHGVSDIFFKQIQTDFAFRQWRFPCKRRRVYTGHQTRTQCHVLAHVILLAQRS